MAYANVVGCDLCDAVVLHGEGNMLRVRILTERIGGGSENTQDAALCESCAAPVLQLQQALMHNFAHNSANDKRLVERIRTVLEKKA